MDVDENKFEALAEIANKIPTWQQTTHLFPTEVNAILSVIDERIKAGDPLEDLFSYNEARKTWKLKRKYLLSAKALDQRRKAAKRPKRKNDPLKNISGNHYKKLLARCRSLKESINRFCIELEHAKELCDQ